MKQKRYQHFRYALALLATAAIAGCAPDGEETASAAAPANKDRIVTLGGTNTEIVFALGEGGRLAGVDVSSLYPPDASKLPQVGYQRTISAENVLSLEPSLILATEESGPPTAIQQLKSSGVKIVTVSSSDHSIDGVKARIKTIAATLDRDDRGNALIDSLEREMEQVRSLLTKTRSSPTVMFIYTRGQGAMQVSGRGTAADAIIALAGGKNAVTAYENYKPLTAEGAVTANPDVILVPERALQTMGGIDGLLRQPGIAQTTAGKNRRVIAMDDLLLLGFGPRLPEAIGRLARSIHPELEEGAR